MVVGMVMGVYAAVHFGWWEWEGRERKDGDIWKCTFSKAMRTAPVKPTASFLFEVTVPKSRYESGQEGQEGQEVGWLGWRDRELTCGRLAKGLRCWLVVKKYDTGCLSLLVPLDLLELLGASIPCDTLGDRGLHIEAAHLPWHRSETCRPTLLACAALALEQLHVVKRICVWVSLLGPDQAIGARGRIVVEYLPVCWHSVRLCLSHGCGACQCSPGEMVGRRRILLPVLHACLFVVDRCEVADLYLIGQQAHRLYHRGVQACHL